MSNEARPSLFLFDYHKELQSYIFDKENKMSLIFRLRGVREKSF